MHQGLLFLWHVRGTSAYKIEWLRMIYKQHSFVWQSAVRCLITLTGMQFVTQSRTHNCARLAYISAHCYLKRGRTPVIY
jgi:hypothetical protein